MLFTRRSIARSCTALAAALFATACGELAQAPELGRGTSFALALALPGAGTANSAFGADIDGVRIYVSRQSEETVVDTLIPWALNDAEFRLAVNIPLVQRVETLYVNVDLMAGQSTRYYGYGEFIVREEALPALPLFEMYYVGPGYDAVFMTVTPRGLVVAPNATSQMGVSVQNGQGQNLTAPVVWSVSDTRLATISATGLLTAKSRIGPVWVKAKIPTGLADSVQVLIGTQTQSP